MEKIGRKVVDLFAGRSSSLEMDMKIKVSRITYCKIIFFVFSFLFLSPVLSPQINGFTIYLSWFVPLLDICFLRYISKYTQKIKRSHMIIFLLLSGLVVFRGNYIVMMKITTIIFSLLYLQYAYTEVGFFMLYKAFNINIFIAIIQFILYCADPDLAYLIGPGNISGTIWGSHATATFTNFFPVFWKIPRACGLSREAGFFAALLNIMTMIYCFDKKVKRKCLQIVLYMIAFFISFSKMSMMFPVILLCMWLKRYINKTPLVIGFGITWLVLGCISIYLNKIDYFTPEHESLSHRLYGYGIVLSDLSIKEMFMGNKNGISQLDTPTIKAWPIYQHLFTRGYTSFCGYPQLIVCFGYIGLSVFLTMLHLMGMGTAELFILLFSTFDVDLTTATSFVVLSYWFVCYGIKYYEMSPRSGGPMECDKKQ